MKKFIPATFALISFSFSSLLGDMQDTGHERPNPFFQFGDPNEIMYIPQKLLPSNARILDAGAFNGHETLHFARMWPNGHVYSFEPVTQLFNRVREKTKHFSNISAYRLALGDFIGTTEIFLSVENDYKRVGMSSSLYHPKEHLVYSDAIFHGSEMVNVTTIDNWAEQNHVSKIDMLWLDMQGYELPALKASPRILSTVSIILTELEFVEAYQGQPLYLEVKEWLEGQGFVLVAGNFTFPKDPKQWFGDGLFVRRELLNKLN